MKEGFKPLKGLEGYTRIEIPGVPFIKQERPNWCGYAGLSTLLQHRRYAIEPIDLFKKTYPEYANVNHVKELDADELAKKKGPSYHELAFLAQEIVEDEYKPAIFYKEKYKYRDRNMYLERGNYHDLQRRNPKITPIFLLDTFLKKHRPVMLRYHSHNVVAAGIAENSRGEKKYLIHNPISEGPKWTSEDFVTTLWSKDDEKQTIAPKYDTEDILPIMSSAYLMMTLPPTRNKTR